MKKTICLIILGAMILACWQAQAGFDPDVLFSSITELPKEVRAEIPDQLVLVGGARIEGLISLLFEAEDDTRFGYIFERTDAGYRLACVSAPLPTIDDFKPTISCSGDDFVIWYSDVHFAFHRYGGSKIWELIGMTYVDVSITDNLAIAENGIEKYTVFSIQNPSYPVERDLSNVDIITLPWTLADAFALYDTRTEADAFESMMEADVSSLENEYTFLAVLNRFNPPSSMWALIEEEVDASRLDESRAVHANFFSSKAIFAVLILPEESGTEEAYSKVGARVTFDKTFDTILNDSGLESQQLPLGVLGVILEPKRVEIVGDEVYGVIVEISENYMILDARGENARPTGIHTRYTITPDTFMFSTFQEGSGCHAIVDKDGVVLAMVNADG